METNEWNNAEILNRQNKGNELLYGFCADPDNWLNKEYLSPQIWLIGRSYAASPQRHKSHKNSNMSADGTDTFFNELADNLLDMKDYRELIEAIKTLKTERYSYVDSGKDEKILIQTAESVISFNRILREAIKKTDKTDDDDLINFISFSSKLLHFYVPEVFYITDSVSAGTLRSAFNSNCGLASVDVNDKKRYTELLKTLKHEVNYSSPNAKIKENGLDYIKHCCRAYILSCKLYKEADTKIITVPRALDNYLLYWLSPEIKKCKNN